MALLFTNATSNRVVVTAAASINSLATGTMLAWIYPTANGFCEIASKYDDASTGWDWYFMQSLTAPDQCVMNVRFTAGARQEIKFNQSFSLNTWYCLAAVWDAATAANCKAYAGTLAAALADITSANSNTGTISNDSSRNLGIGNITTASPTYGFKGRMATFAIWNRRLSLGELQEQQFHPHPTSGCVLFIHLYGTGTQPDLSGNGNNGTVTGATATDHVPLGPLFGRESGIWIPTAAGGGPQSYFQTISGVFAPAGLAIKQSSKPLAGAESPTGTLLKQANKTLAGSEAPAGALQKSTTKTAAGSLSPTGSTSAIKVALLALVGSLTPAAVLSKSAGKSLAGTVTSAGIVSRLSARLVTGVLTTSGLLIKTPQRFLSGAISSTGTLRRDASRLLTSVLSLAGSVSRSSARSLSGTITSAGSVSKTVTHQLAGALSPAGAVSAVRALLLNLSGALSPTSTLQASIVKNLSGSVGPSSVISNAISRTLAGAVGLAGLVAASILGALSKTDVAVSSHVVTQLAATDSALTKLVSANSALYSVSLGDATR